MRCHRLTVFERAASFQISCDACGAESMATHTNAHAEIDGATMDHAPCVNTFHPPFGQGPGAACCGAEEGGLPAVADFRRVDISVDIGLLIVMRRHLMDLVALFNSDHPSVLNILMWRYLFSII